jgi:hypothetical protein
MRILACLLMLCCSEAPSAFGRDAAERLRERVIFCSQFVIEHPSRVVVPDSTRDCCWLANTIHNCHLIIQEEKHN